MKLLSFFKRRWSRCPLIRSWCQTIRAVLSTQRRPRGPRSRGIASSFGPAERSGVTDNMFCGDTRRTLCIEAAADTARTQRIQLDYIIRFASTTCRRLTKADDWKTTSYASQYMADWLIDRVKVLRPTRHKIVHFRDLLPGQSLGLVLKNQNKHNKSKYASGTK